MELAPSAFRADVVNRDAVIRYSAGSFSIPPDDPCLNGHFPGRPAVPGVVLLDEAVCLLRDLLALGELLEVQGAKFLHPVQPGDCVDVLYSDIQDRSVAFSCAVNGRAVAAGTAHFT